MREFDMAASSARTLLDRIRRHTWGEFHESGWTIELAEPHPHSADSETPRPLVPTQRADDLIKKIETHKWGAYPESGWSVSPVRPALTLIESRTDDQKDHGAMPIWQRSSRQAEPGGIEVTSHGDHILVRDAKSPTSSHLHFTYKEWSEFVSGILSGEFVFAGAA
ncbi:DUF397 domain-containing protein [Actinoplanes regularis]|uniref:DUF397 domain-containing protein n=1 Tax=Actinoplanes regularis TaxID=52697 RepID=UPI0024A4D138|nr:DUF397 domain-containing protein [Actinoplanes regularis]GLW33176.1 hypothetical protein Areg01_61140 [Actinoplanes regularis]